MKVVLKILKHTNKKDLEMLKLVSAEVTDFNQELKDFANEMFKVMPEHGIAMSAIQVCHPIRMFVWRGDEIKCPNKVIINPVILEATGRMKYEERCLSFPNLIVKVKRKSFTRMKYQDLDGKEKEYQVSGEEAVCIQHEINHMDGILISDHGPLYRDS